MNANQEVQQTCPNCKNRAMFDRQQSITYCKNKSCQGLIIEFGHISYEQEVNLHENEDQKQKQTRFGGFESRKDQFVNRLQDLLNDQDGKGRERTYKRFEHAEHIIHRLASQFEIKEAIIKEIVVRFRDLLTEHITKQEVKLSFETLAVIAFIQISDEKRKKEWQFGPQKLLTDERISEFAGISIEKVNLTKKKLSISHVLTVISIDQDRAHIKQKELEDLMRSSTEFGFSEDELEATQKLYDNLMNSTLIKGQKPSTIYSIVQLCLSQLSHNPQIGSITVEQISQKNGVTKETIKNIWNKIVDQLATTSSDLIPHSPLRKSANELKSIQ